MTSESLQSDPGWLLALKRTNSNYVNLLDPRRITTASRAAELIAGRGDEFSSDPAEGRGLSYIRAQRQQHVRFMGIQNLLAKFNSLVSPTRATDPVVADLLGGDALIARIVHENRPQFGNLAVLTSDVSEDMVQAALEQGFPAIRQAAQSLAFKSASLSGVLLAYGTHHIPHSDRRDVSTEAFRVLEPGGRLVIHDFPTNSPVARWFEDIVHRYSKTGHAHQHFEEGELNDLLACAHFDAVDVGMVYDPLIVTGATRDSAWEALGTYLLDMYGLDLLMDELGRDRGIQRTLELARECFVYDYEALGLRPDFGVRTVRDEACSVGVRVECPRVAIVATGVKPLGWS